MRVVANQKLNQVLQVIGLLILTVFISVSTASAESEESAFDNEKKSTLRDPFWPVGYQPEQEESSDEADGEGIVPKEIVHKGEEGWARAMELVEIQGVSSRAGNEFFAVINGEVKTVGDSVSVQLGNAVYSWVVGSITPPGSVKLRRESVQ